MRTPEEWNLFYNESWANDICIPLIDIIKEAQKEAWNESILLSAESATVFYTSDMSGRHYRVNKQSILQNLIP